MSKPVFTINVTGLKQVQAFTKKALSKQSLSKLRRDIIRDTSNVVIMHVRARYIKASQARPSNGISQGAERLGKDWGEIDPARPPHPSNMRGYLPLARAVTKKWINGGYSITIDQKARMYNGKPAFIVARMLEDPRPINIPLTLRKLVYEKLVRTGKGGYGTKTTDKVVHMGGKVIKTVVFMPRRVPVWREIYQQTLRFTLYQTSHRAIINHIGRLVRQFGGKIRA